MVVRVVERQEFEELVKAAVNCLVKPDCIKYRLNNKQLLIDFGNDRYRLVEK